MDIIYRADTFQILHVYHTSGAIQSNGTISREEVFKFLLTNNVPFHKAAVWPYINTDDRAAIPPSFYTNYKDFSVVIDPVLKKPFAIQKGSNIYVLQQPKHHTDDIPLIWTGTFLDSISYSLINRKFAFGIADKGYNIKAAVFKNRIAQEISAAELKKLDSLGAAKSPHMELKQAIRLYCFLPTERVIPSSYNICFTMMETETVNPTLINTLNSYYNECWFPCFVKNTYIKKAKNRISRIDNMLLQDKVATHTGHQERRILTTNKKKYSGKLYTLQSKILEEHLVCTPEHPIFVANGADNVLAQNKDFVDAKKLTRNHFLYYPRNIHDGESIVLDLQDFFKRSGFVTKLRKGKLQVYKNQKYYNHMLDKTVWSKFALKGNCRVNSELCIDESFAAMLGIIKAGKIRKSQETKYESKHYIISLRSEDHANLVCSQLQRISDEPFTSSQDKEEFNIVIASDIIYELLNNAEIFFEYFSLKHKRSFLKSFLKECGRPYYHNYEIEFNDFKIAPYIMEFLLDCGVVAKAEGLSENAKRQYFLIDVKQAEQLWEVLDGSVERDGYRHNKDQYFIFKDGVYVKLHSISFKEVKEIDVFNLEVHKDNSYIANFAAVHNCNFNRDKFIENGLVTNTHKMPLGFDDKAYHPNVQKTEGINFKLLNPSPERFSPKPQGFTFLAVFRCSYRKGPDVLIKAFREAFSSQDNVSLIIFSRHYWGNIQNDKIDTVKACEDYLSKWIEHDNDAPPIYWSSDHLSDEQMPGLYAHADCFVSTSRGEGFCTLPSAIIRTPNGVSEIKDINVGDLVLSHIGLCREVTHVFKRQYSGDIIEISSYGRGSQKLSLTPNHKVRCLKASHASNWERRQLKKITYNKDKDSFDGIPNGCFFDWVEAGEVSSGDYLFYANQVKESIEIDCIYISDYLLNDGRFIFENDIIYTVRRNQYGECGKKLILNINKIELDDDFCRLLGYYIAEGCTSNSDIMFSFNVDEKAYHDDVIYLMKKIFDIKPGKHQLKKNSKAYTLKFYNIAVASFLKEIAGGYARCKRMPDSFVNWKEKNKDSLIKGLIRGDGNITFKLSLQTSSILLAEQFMEYLSMKNVSASINKRLLKGKEYYAVRVSSINFHNVICKDVSEYEFAKQEGRTYSVSIIGDGWRLLRVRSVKKNKYNGFVHNIGVDGENSYICENIAVHNCLPPIEAAACGIPVIAPNHSGFGDYMSPERGYVIDTDGYENIGKVVTKNGQPVYEGSNAEWAVWITSSFRDQEFPIFGESVVKQTAEHMKRVYYNYSEAKEKAEKMRRFVLENFTWDKCIDSAIIRLNEIKGKLK